MSFNLFRSCFVQCSKTAILTGPSMCGKTSLLFDFALNCAEDQCSVLFIAPQCINHLPLFVNNRSQPKPEVLKYITFIYLTNYDELITFLSNIHCSSTPVNVQPDYVIIDDFQIYLMKQDQKMEETKKIAKIMAFITDALKFFEKKSRGQICLLLCRTSDEKTGNDQTHIYNHWIRTFYNIKSKGNGYFQIQNSHHSKVTQTYQLCDNGINLTDDI